MGRIFGCAARGFSGSLARMQGKGGSTMVEAAIVLPMLLLTVLSMILLVMYFYASLDAQVRTQRTAIEEGQKSRAVFRVIRKEDTTQMQMRGIMKDVMVRDYGTKHYVFNMGEAIRLGKRFTGE